MSMHGLVLKNTVVIPIHCNTSFVNYSMTDLHLSLFNGFHYNTGDCKKYFDEMLSDKGIIKFVT